MQEIINRESIAVLWSEILKTQFPLLEEVGSKGHLKDELGLDSLQLMDLAAELHFRFDMVKGDESLYLLQYQYAQEWIDAIFMAANKPDNGFGFFSSGSSGKPKPILHSKKHLIAELDFWLEKLAPKRIICLVPTRHIYGFIWGLMLGSKVSNVRFYAKEQWHLLFTESTEDDVIIAHPAALQIIKNYFPHRLIISSTAALEPTLERELCEAGFRGLSIYGSSETGAIGYQEWLKEAYQILPYWSLNNQSLTHLGKVYPIPDQLEEVEEGQFLVGARKDGVVQIGGQNISLLEIQQKLTQVNGVKQAWVKPYQDQWGTRLFAHLQKEPNQEDKSIESELKILFQSFSSEMKPKQIYISEAAFSKFDTINKQYEG